MEKLTTLMQKTLPKYAIKAVMGFTHIKNNTATCTDGYILNHIKSFKGYGDCLINLKTGNHLFTAGEVANEAAQ